VCHWGCERVCLDEDIGEKLGHTPDVFPVERHFRGKWMCKNSETLIQAPGSEGRSHATADPQGK
jgi:transposase